MWSDTVRYYFNSSQLGRVLVPEPRNYKDGNGATYTRDSDSKGIMRVNSNELEFFGEGYDYLMRINTIYGVVPDVRVDKWVKDEKRLDQRWTYIGSFGLDITSLIFNNDNRTVKASYTNGGLADKLDSRISDDYDLIETTGGTDGVDIGELETVICSLPGKAIFLESQLSIDEGVEVRTPVSTSFDPAVRAVPFQIVTNSDGEAFNNDTDNIYNTTYLPLGYAGNTFVNGQQGGITYLNSERDRNLNLKGRINFKLDPQKYHIGTLILGIVKYNNGLELDFKEFIEFESIVTTGAQDGIDYSFDLPDFEVLEGESFTFAYVSATLDGIGVFYQEGNYLQIIDEQPAPATTTRALTYYQILDRLMARAFGKVGLIDSELLTTGEIKDTLKTNGFFIRQFPDVVNEGTDEERRIQFITSIKDQLDALNAILPIAYWVTTKGDKEVLRVERLDYTQQGFTGIHYGEKKANGRIEYIPAKEMTRTVLPDNYYSSSQIGSTTTGSNYDDFFGLTSFNGNATYNYINDSKGSPYIATTSDRTGDLDIEIIRRKPYDKFKDTDTSMDEDIFFIDAKKVSTGYYTPRTWEDDFEEKPLNVYSPETAFNFRYSPARLLLNHSYVLMAGLYHYPLDYARFSSSNCNSSLITKVIGEEELKEGQSIQHTRFTQNRIIPMMAEFTMPVSYEIEQQINGFQSDGTPNWFGRVAVMVDGNIEYFRMIDIDTNKEGSHKMVESA